MQDPDSDNEMYRVGEVTCTSAVGNNRSAKSVPATPEILLGGSALSIDGAKGGKPVASTRRVQA